MDRWARLCIGASFLLAAACGALNGGADSTATVQSFLLPDHPPDFEAPDLRENLDSIWGAPVDAMAVVFIPGLSREHKTRLVKDVGAYELVGGAPYPEEARMDGIYLLRIRTDGTMKPLLKAIDDLHRSPEIITAFALTSLSSDR